MKSKREKFLEYEVNVANEQTIIASAVKSKKKKEKIFSKIEPKDFVARRHRNIFQVLLWMRRRDLKFNEDTFMQMAGDLDVGKVRYVRKIISTFDANTNINFHIEQLKADRLKFDLYRGPVPELMDITATRSSDKESIIEIANKISERIRKETGLDGTLDKEELRKMYLKDFKERAKIKFIGTGLKELDDKLIEGFSPSTVSIIAGRPSMGKTIFMLNVIFNLSHSKKMLICEIEMGTLMIMDMYISLCTGIKLDKLIKESAQLTLSERKRIRRKAKQITENENLIFMDDPKLTLDRLEIELKNNKYDICFIDLFSRLNDVVPSPEGFTRKLYQVKRIVRMTGTHICLIHQMKRRTGKESKRPTLEKLKDSGTFEEAADLVLGVHREKYYRPQLAKDIAEIIVLKQKRGESGVSVPFRFNGHICELGEYEKDYAYGRDFTEF